MTAWWFALAGAAAGVGQALSLSRSARLRAGPLQTAARLALVASVLCSAAAAGSLLPAAAGWACGLTASGLALVWRWP
jgi:TRAP-type C4-dicarboxylate transport system permease small subunit